MSRPLRAVARSLFATTLVTSLFGGEAAAHPQDHLPIAPVSPLVLRCRLDQGEERKTLEVPIDLPSQVVAHDLEQVVELPPPFPPVRLVRYLPLSVMEQRVVAVPPGEGAAAIRLVIEGPTRSFERCLIEGNPIRDRMTSLIATWRLLSVEDDAGRDALFARFEQEMSRPPTIRIEGPGGARAELPAEPGLTRDLDALGCSVRVIGYYSSFSRDQKTGAPISHSDRRLNPAVHLELRRGDRAEERWSFTRYPRFRLHETEELPYTVTLDCPVETEVPTPSFVVVVVGDDRAEVWTRYRATSSSREVDVDDAVEIPDSRYTFRLARVEPSAHLQERYVPTDDQKAGITALRIEVPDRSGAGATHWLAMAVEQSIDSSAGPLALSFDSSQRRPDADGGHHTRGH